MMTTSRTGVSKAGTGRVAAVLGTVVTAGWLLVACGGSTPPAEAPSNEPPSLEDDDAEATAAAPASPKVKEAADAIQAGDFARAKALLADATAEGSKDAQAFFYLGVAEEGLGEADAAVGHYRKALGLDQKLSEASTNLSGLLLDREDVAGALAAADAGLKTAPRNPALLRNRAVALDAQGSKEALAAFDAAVAAAGATDEEVRYLQAEALARAGQAAKAVAAATKLAQSEDVAVLASVGRLLGKLKAFPECVTALDRAVGKKDVAELRVQRGICKHGTKDDKGAEADFSAAVAAEPRYAPGHYYLGQHRKAQGDKKGARAELQKAVELDAQGGIGAAAKKALSEL